MGKVEQCQFTGQRMADFMGGRIKELTRCQERGDSFWHDEIGDAYCPRHEKIIKKRAGRNGSPGKPMIVLLTPDI